MSLVPRPLSLPLLPLLPLLLLLACSYCPALASPPPLQGRARPLKEGGVEPLGAPPGDPAWLLSGDALRELTLFEVAAELRRAFPAETSDILHSLTQQLVDLPWWLPDGCKPTPFAVNDEMSADASEARCGEAERRRRTEEGVKWVLDELDVYLENETDPGRDLSPCSICKPIAGALQTAAALNLTQKVATELLISVCENVTALVGVRGDVLCRPTLELQMPHVFEAIKVIQLGIAGLPAGPEEVCQFLNLCLPPPAATATRVHHAQRQQASDEHAAIKSIHSHGDNLDSVMRRGLHGSDPEGIPGNAIKVVQITDVHIEPEYQAGTETNCGLPVCCVEAYGRGNAGLLGDYNCNIPRRTMETFLAKVASLNPDVILFTGDVPPHSVWDETSESQRECSQLLVQAINTTLSGYNVYPNVGNHEMYPTNLYSMVKDSTSNTQDFARWHAELWREVANFSSEQTSTMSAGGYYTLPLGHGLRLISFNSNYMYTFNWYNIVNHRNRTLPARIGEYLVMQNFVETALAEAKRDGEKVILMGHHPPGGSDYLIEASRWYRELVLLYKEIIVLQPAGHTHLDEMRLIYDNAGVPSSVVLVSPSMNSGGSRNPSMRVFYLDAVDKHLLDYQQHVMDLSVKQFAAGNSVDWTDLIQPLYSARHEYALPNLSPASWDQLLTRFESDRELLGRHRAHSQAGAQSSLALCSARCRAKHICRQRHINFDEYRACLPPLNLPTVPTLPARPTQDPGDGSGGAALFESWGGAAWLWSGLVLLQAYFL